MVLAESLRVDQDDASDQTKRSGPSSRRKCLHVLYLLHDVLHDLHHHQKSSLDAHAINEAFGPCLKDLVRPLSSCQGNDIYASKLRSILAIWQRGKYLVAATISELQRLSTDVSDKTEFADAIPMSNGPDRQAIPQFMMPEHHGDASIPFYDLPAATMLPHIIPNSTRPLDPQLLRPLRFTPGPADKNLARALEIFLEDADSVYAQDQRQEIHMEVDIDPLGQQIWRDEYGRPVDQHGSYYGWSHQFCKTIKNGSSIHSIVDDKHEQLPGCGSLPEIYSNDAAAVISRSQSPRSSQSRTPSRSYSPPSPSIYRNNDGQRGTAISQRPLNRSPPVDPRRRAAIA